MVRTPRRAAVRRTRRAISPRLATSRDSNTSSDTSEVGLAVVVLVLAVAAGLAAGGRVRQLGAVHLNRRALVLAAVLAQTGGAAAGVLGVADARRAYVAGLAVSAACALLFC